MASTKGLLLAFFFFLIATVAVAHSPSMASWSAQLAQVPSPAPAIAPGPESDTCIDLATSYLLDCLDYVTDNSNDTKVSRSCCSGFSSITNSNPLCLCDIISKNSTFADELDLNRSKALTLPDVCNVTIPPISLCSAAGYEIDIPGLPQSPPLDKCAGVVVDNMVECISYVQEGGSSAMPNKKCCMGYSNLLDSDPQCLCKLVLNSTSVLPGFDLNMTRAVNLPSQCNAELPMCIGEETPGAPPPGEETPGASSPGSTNPSSPKAENSAIANFRGFFKVVVLLASFLLSLITIAL